MSLNFYGYLNENLYNLILNRTQYIAEYIFTYSKANKGAVPVSMALKHHFKV